MIRSMVSKALVMMVAVVLMAMEPVGEEDARASLSRVDGVYRVDSVEALRAFAELVREGDGPFTGEVWLMCDLDGVGRMPSIGSLENMFLGVFDGRGHVISGLRPEESGSFCGMFGYVGAGGRVCNLVLEDVRVSGTRYVGGVAAYNAGTIERCAVVEGHIGGNAYLDYGVATGGVAGLSCGEILECVNRNTRVNGGRCVGGIVGSQCAARVERCLNSGRVSSLNRGQAMAGGIAGSVQTEGAVRGCVNLAGVEAPFAEWTGGIVGALHGGKLTGCLNLGGVQARERGAVAGYKARRAQLIRCCWEGAELPGVGEGSSAGVMPLHGTNRRGDLQKRLLRPLMEKVGP